MALGTALALYATGVLDLGQALAGLGDPAVIFIASLFVVSAGLDATGVTAWAGQLLIAKAGESRTRLLVLIMVLVSLLTALISVNGAVAALLPVVVVMAIRLSRPTSQLLMPLVFSAHAGALLALTGTPVNVLVSEAAVDAGVGALRLLRVRHRGDPAAARDHGDRRAVRTAPAAGAERPGDAVRPQPARPDAREQYRLDDGLFQLRVRSSSPYVGAPRTAVDLKEYPGLTLVGVQDGDGQWPAAAAPHQRGRHPHRARRRGLPPPVWPPTRPSPFGLRMTAAMSAETLFNRASGLAEVVIPPRSGMIGQTVFPGMVTPSGDLIILAVQRRGEDQGPNETVLAAGDTLLLQGTWKALDEHLDDPDVLVVDSPELVRRQAVPMGVGAKQAIAVLLAMVVLLATGAVPAVIAGLVAACAMVLLGVLTVEQAYRAINWTTVILVGAMIPLSTAMDQSGAAATHGGDARARGRRRRSLRPAGRALRAHRHPRPAHQQHGDRAHRHPDRGVRRHRHGGVSAAGVDERRRRRRGRVPHPRGHPGEPDGDGTRRVPFGDYWKLGLPLLLWFFVVATFIVPVFWRF